MLDSYKMLQKQSEKYVFVGFFPSLILLHNILLKFQIAFLKFTSCDNPALVGCIPIAAVAVFWKIGQSSLRCIAIT